MLEFVFYQLLLVGKKDLKVSIVRSPLNDNEKVF